MSYLVLARKYRPKTFEQLVGQSHVVQALLYQGIGQGLNHVLLPHHFGEIAGAVFAREDKVRHDPDSIGLGGLDQVNDLFNSGINHPYAQP